MNTNDDLKPRPLTFGEKAVGIQFNPGKNPVVDSLKRKYADVLDECFNLRETSTDPEVKRMASIAITEAQTSQMWAVKAATWQ